MDPMQIIKTAGLALLMLATAGCKDENDTLAPGETTHLEITSDPDGGNIEVDEISIGKTTPTTLNHLLGRHTIVVRLERDGIAYGYRTEVDVKRDSLHRVTGPLTNRCAQTPCLAASSRYRDMGNLRISSQANGALFLRASSGQGLFWPGNTTDSYASTGMPMIAMLTATHDTLALGIYDTDYLAGRPAPVLETTPERTTLRQTTWIIPFTSVIINNMPSVRGIEVEEEVIGTPNSDVVYIKLTYRNITDRESYRAADPVVPSVGMQFEQVYIGFALDPDIGISADDMVTYEPALDLVYAYDSNMLEENFSAASRAAPGLVGLKIVSAPTGATVRALNTWPIQYGFGSGDWSAGTATERSGFSILSGTSSYEPDYPGQQLGYVPSLPSDFRMSVTAGPVNLAPGEAATITVAVILAPPVPGEYTSGELVPPGNPGNSDRQIRRIAATLFERAANVVAP